MSGSSFSLGFGITLWRWLRFFGELHDHHFRSFPLSGGGRRAATRVDEIILVSSHLKGRWFRRHWHLLLHDFCLLAQLSLVFAWKLVKDCWARLAFLVHAAHRVAYSCAPVWRDGIVSAGRFLRATLQESAQFLRMVINGLRATSSFRAITFRFTESFVPVSCKTILQRSPFWTSLA